MQNVFMECADCFALEHQPNKLEPEPTTEKQEISEFLGNKITFFSPFFCNKHQGTFFVNCSKSKFTLRPVLCNKFQYGSVAFPLFVIYQHSYRLSECSAAF